MDEDTVVKQQVVDTFVDMLVEAIGYASVVFRTAKPGVHFTNGEVLETINQTIAWRLRANRDEQARDRSTEQADIDLLHKLVERVAEGLGSQQ